MTTPKQIVLSYYEEILCRKGNQDPQLEMYLKSYQQHVNVRELFFKSNEYVEQIKPRPVLFYLRSKKYSGESISILANQYIDFLRGQGYLVSSIDYDESLPLEDDLLPRLRELCYNHPLPKQVVIHCHPFAPWVHPLLQWWNAQLPVSGFSSQVIGITTTPLPSSSRLDPLQESFYRLFSTLLLPSPSAIQQLSSLITPSQLVLLPFPLRMEEPSLIQRYDPLRNPIITVYFIENHPSRCIQTLNWILEFCLLHPTIPLRIQGKTTIPPQDIYDHVPHYPYFVKHISLVGPLLSTEEMTVFHHTGNLFLSLFPKETTMNLSDALLFGNLVISPDCPSDYFLPTYPYQLRTTDPHQRYLSLYHSPLETTSPSTTFEDIFSLALTHFSTNQHLLPLQEMQHFLLQSSPSHTIQTTFSDLFTNMKRG